MSGASDQVIFDLIRSSTGYKLTDPRDRKKVELALDNKPSLRPRSAICRAAWELAKRDTVGPPVPVPVPPTPIPTYVKVAPRVAHKEGGSDARFCTVDQPGVRAEPGAPAGHTIDDSGATYDDNGLCKNGKRSDGPAATSALEIDGRPYCALPTIGDPKQNTGSWAI